MLVLQKVHDVHIRFLHRFRTRCFGSVDEPDEINMWALINNERRRQEQQRKHRASAGGQVCFIPVLDRLLPGMHLDPAGDHILHHEPRVLRRRLLRDDLREGDRRGHRGVVRTLLLDLFLGQQVLLPGEAQGVFLLMPPIRHDIWL